MSSKAQTTEILDQTSTERMMAQAKEQVNGQTGGYWAIVVMVTPQIEEQMAKQKAWKEQREGGYLTEFVQFDVKWARLEQPNKAGGFEPVFFHPKTIVAIIPCDEEEARAQALKTQYAPVRAWQALSESAGLRPTPTGGQDEPIYTERQMVEARQQTAQLYERQLQREMQRAHELIEHERQALRGQIIQPPMRAARRFGKTDWVDDLNNREIDTIYGFTHPDSKNPLGLAQPKPEEPQETIKKRVQEFIRKGKKP